MKAFKLDAENHMIQELQLPDDVSERVTEMHAIIGDTFCFAYEFPNGDTVFCDDNGLLKDPSCWTIIYGAHQPFAGNCVVVGPADNDGNETDCRSSLFDLANQVRFRKTGGYHD